MSVPALANEPLPPPVEPVRRGRAMRTARAVILGLVGLLILVAMYRYFAPRAPERWTRANALRLAPPPTLTDDSDVTSLLNAIDQSLAWAGTRAESTTLTYGPHTVPLAALTESLRDLRHHVETLGLSPMLFDYVRSNFTFYTSAAPRVLVTGYFEASLRGSLTPTTEYAYPLYGRPADLVIVDLAAWSWLDIIGRGLPKTLRARIAPYGQLVPYFSRTEIDYGGALAGRGLELLWVDDPIDAFFLQIQGSGVITLPDGSLRRVGYAEKNGHPYRPIGKRLIEKGVLERGAVSAQSIEAYLRAHPAEQREIFEYNPSYVFFELRNTGPLGNLGVPVTGGRSIATDAELLPPGAIGFLETEKPTFDSNGQVIAWEKFGRFVLNQDTGGAIVGPGRVDLFTGFGPAAKATAGVMQQPGSLYVLLKRSLIPPQDREKPSN